MPSIRVFEPAMCCNTGVCGPDVDENLVRFTADLDAVRQEGADIARANLATEPGAFAASPVVLAFLDKAGSEQLPLTLVDDTTVLTGRYPTRTELKRWAGMSPSQSAVDSQPVPLPVVDSTSGSCCSGGSACC
ncbi:arsenite efflux transporter metallochaperone ArsD [Ancrocorticia populi]|uniref:arsenite efflux transporter metallochaperone ArsD n=1 Tax=Ancrocorticia populi TaxID=2175228 RepID=UPI003F8F9FA2